MQELSTFHFVYLFINPYKQLEYVKQNKYDQEIDNKTKNSQFEVTND